MRHRFGSRVAYIVARLPGGFLIALTLRLWPLAPMRTFVFEIGGA